MEVMEAIRTRRSIRKFKPDPVDEELLMKVLEAARWAPSWANTQCWRFVVVRDPKIKEELAGTLESLNPRNPAIPAIRSAPVVIAICAELGKSGFYRGQPATEKGDWYMFDAALAAQNLVLAAHSLGLGTVHVGFFDGRKAAEILEVPEGMAVVELVPLGWPDEKPSEPPRKELSELVSFDKFGRQAR